MNHELLVSRIIVNSPPAAPSSAVISCRMPTSPPSFINTASHASTPTTPISGNSPSSKSSIRSHWSDVLPRMALCPPGWVICKSMITNGFYGFPTPSSTCSKADRNPQEKRFAHPQTSTSNGFEFFSFPTSPHLEPTAFPPLTSHYSRVKP